MPILTIMALAMAVAPQQAGPDITLISAATDTLLDQSPSLDSSEFRDVRIVSLPGRHQAVCGEVGGGAGFRRFAYDTVTKTAGAEGGGGFAALWANCGS